MAATAIAFGITDLDVGGAEGALVELVSRLDRTRWLPTVVCVQPAGPLAEKLHRVDVAVDSLGVRSPLDVVRALNRWTQILKDRRPQLLQTFLFHANLLGRIAARRAAVPKVVSGLRVAERRWNLHASLDRWTRRKVDCYTCVSRGVADFARKCLLVRDEQIQVIPNAVDTDLADRATPVNRESIGCSQSDTILLFVGRLDPQKGLFDLLDAVSFLGRSLPAEQIENLKLVLVGDGPLRGEIEGRIVKLQVGAKVQLVGWKSNVWDWLAMADGLLLPSHWEGMPNVVLEAMAARLPVIATDVEGSQELVVAGKSGWLVSPKNPIALAAAIAEFARSPLRRSYGQAGRELVERCYSHAAMVAKYDELYSRLVGRP